MFRFDLFVSVRRVRGRSLAIGFLAILTMVQDFRLAAGAAVEAWVGRYDGPGNGSDVPHALALDARNGNLYVAGYSVGTNGYIDFATVAYTGTGMPLWTNRYDGSAHIYDSAQAVAVDGNTGTVYVTGYSYGTDREYFVTIAYSSGGTPLWTNKYNRATFAYAEGWAVAVGTNGNVYVAGSVGSMDADYATLAYSAAGVPLWTNAYSGSSNRASADFIEAMTVDKHGHVYVTGWSDSATGPDFATIAYSEAGTPLWTNRYTSSDNHNNTATAIAADSAGNVYVAGYSQGIGTGADYATVAYSPAGTALWTNRYNGDGNNTDSPKAVAVDGAGRVYVTGESVNSSGHFDYATIAYSNNGTPLWTNWYNARPDLDASARAVVVDSYGNIIVTGFSTGTDTDRDLATVAYTSNGKPLWTNRYDGPGRSADQIGGPLCIGADPAGAIYITGSSGGVGTYTDFATIKYVPVPDIGFTGIRPLPRAGLRLTINAPTNTPYRLEASTDLANWLTLTNFPPLPRKRNNYTDKSTGGLPRRFYRTVWSP